MQISIHNGPNSADQTTEMETTGHQGINNRSVFFLNSFECLIGFVFDSDEHKSLEIIIKEKSDDKQKEE